jgi:hypothetical protein
MWSYPAQKAFRLSSLNPSASPQPGQEMHHHRRWTKVYSMHQKDSALTDSLMCKDWGYVQDTPALSTVCVCVRVCVCANGGVHSSIQWNQHRLLLGSLTLCPSGQGYRVAKASPICFQGKGLAEPSSIFLLISPVSKGVSAQWRALHS